VNVHYHAFTRSADGTITTFDAASGFLNTSAEAINPAGTITGNFANAGDILHSFVRAHDGTVTTFNVAPGLYTATYYDTEGVIHGFVRAADGTISMFDAPGSALTIPNSINPAGDIVGLYHDASGVTHGFLRTGN
jgi:hypothetical protein